ncbi:M48 family metallopeptidase [Alicyclobacillus dauci]|uniref:M48 family metallopeptidase n=1 Tax=Alicyclobacillus dauci TaxID=1475485 RepID=A0ABY6Z801_9BACL|nr:SprT family zinc-dependent metalloprotease [Alicyclobacillus dauci]WAH39038.1 M48 family metallopeptidase [Alicyclobacillus dauci]
MKRVEVGESSIWYERVPPSPRQVRVILRMNGKTLQVSAPRHISTGVIEQVIHKHGDWVLDQLSKALELIQRPLQIGDSVLFLGELCEISLDESSNKSEDPYVRVVDHRQQICLNSHTTPTEVHAKVYTFLRQEARTKLRVTVDRLASKYGCTPHRIVIKEQAKRWGSCSSAGNINLNWRLIQAPYEVQTYVVVHELAHLKEMNHSPKFWHLVSEMMPGFDKYKSWLRANGDSLYRLREHDMLFPGKPQ